MRDRVYRIRTRAGIARVRTCVSVVALCALLAVPTLARATTLERLTVSDMSRRATTVVVGTVVSTTAEARAGGIATAVRVKVTEPLKGVPIGVTTVYVPGGTLPDGTTEVVDGMSTFVPGESVAVFADGLGWVMGGRQGKVGIARGLVAATGQPVSALSGAVRSALGAPHEKAGALGFIDPAGVAALASVQAAAAGPSISGVSPGTVAAGIGATITISGSGFGPTRGSVSFFYQSGQPRIYATDIASWSDTRIVCEVPVGIIDDYDASAGSGPLRVTTAGGASTTDSAASDLHITFGNGEQRWADTYQASPHARVGYRVNPGGVSGAEALVDAAAATWSAAGADFSFVDGGAFSTTPGNNDGKNDVAWAGGLPSGVIAMASSRYWGGTMTESNVTFSTAFNWGTGSGNTMDVQTIATHELGHWLSLRDLYGTDDHTKVMYGFCGYGTVKRTLTSGDLAGILWIYGSAADTIAPTTSSDAKVSYVGTATVTFTATDNAGGSGVARTYHRVDGGAQLEGPTVTISVPGPHTLEFWSVDVAGNVEPVHTVGLTIVPPDTTPPTTVSDAVSGYPEAAVITLTATDAGSGVATTYYVLDGGVQTAGTHVTEARVGEHTLAFWSVDVRGNVEARHEVVFTVAPYDVVPPVTTSDVATSYTGVATIALSAEDDVSGVAATRYLLDSQPVVTGTIVTVSSAGTHTIEYWSEDRAGNVEEHHAATFTVRVQLLKVTLTTPTAPTSVTHNRSFTVTGYVKPRLKAGTIVRLYFYLHTSSGWKVRKTMSVKLANYSSYSRYSVKASLPQKGKWRLRSRFADAAHLTSYSPYRNVTVK